MNPITKIEIPGVKRYYSGKVRDVFQVDSEHYLIVSTDRISAFDHIFPNGIPGKGVILNTISNLWFKKIDFIKNHVVEDNFNNFPRPYSDFPELLSGRSVIVRSARRVDFECVARGYLIGTGWKDYQNSGAVCGIPLPSGLKMAQKLDAPLFTPSTKEDAGHDMNVSFDIMKKVLGDETATIIQQMSLKIYSFARDILDPAGIILADTKFEFGFIDGSVCLIDEVLTPDSSRFWDKEKYIVGTSPVSYDKQFIRDYLDTTTWDKNSPPPPLPDRIVEKTAEKYAEILGKIRSAIK